ARNEAASARSPAAHHPPSACRAAAAEVRNVGKQSPYVPYLSDIREKRTGQFSNKTASFRATCIESRLSAKPELQPVANIGKPDAVIVIAIREARGLALRRLAIIRNGESQKVPLRLRANPHRNRPFGMGDPVLDGIFNQRLQDKAGNQNAH